MSVIEGQLTPGQQQAVRRLKEAIDNIFANGMGIHSIVAVLDSADYIRSGRTLRADLTGTGYELETSGWCVRDDPFRKPRPEDSIIKHS